MEVPSSITDKEIHNYLSEIKHQLTFTHSPKETASIMQRGCGHFLGLSK